MFRTIHKDVFHSVIVKLTRDLIFTQNFFYTYLVEKIYITNGVIFCMKIVYIK